jgi:folate-dependent tRNA-U54 methylase TrmFO/GidA
MKMKRKMSLEVISTETDSVKVGDTFTVAVGLIETPTIKGNKPDTTGDGPNKPKGPKKPKQPTIKEMLSVIMLRLDKLETQFNEFKAEMIEFKQEVRETLARHEEILKRHEEIFVRNGLK